MIIFLFLLWRFFLFLLAFLGSIVLGFAPSFPYSEIYLSNSGFPQWFWKFGNFDGVHYLGIAKHGFALNFTQVFFPVYPMLLKIFSLGGAINPVFSGIVLSGVFFLLSLTVLRRLLGLDYGKNTVLWAMLFFMFFPTSFFFGSIYTESLFLLLVFSSFYFSRKNKWLLAAFLGAMAGATRITGIFLLPALLYEWYLNDHPKRKSKPFTLYPFLSVFRSPVIYLVPLGLLSYMIYLQIAFGDALLYWHSQPVFGASRSGNSIILLPQVIYRYVKMIASNPPGSPGFFIPFFELFSTVFAISALVYGHMKKIRLSYLLYSWPVVMLPTLTGTFSSMPRYILSAFPVFILMGMLPGRINKIILLAICMILLSYLTMLFTSGRWVA